MLPQPIQNARLSLASGVTTIRTTSSIDSMADLTSGASSTRGKNPAGFDPDKLLESVRGLVGR
jgi:hypothetical protein